MLESPPVLVLVGLLLLLLLDEEGDTRFGMRLMPFCLSMRVVTTISNLSVFKAKMNKPKMCSFSRFIIISR